MTQENSGTTALLSGGGGDCDVSGVIVLWDKHMDWDSLDWYHEV